LQIKEIELVEGQQFVKLSQEAADRDLEIYKKAQDLVATQKELLAQAQENVKKAEAKMQLAYEESKSSAKVARKAINRLELLKMNYKPQPVTKYQVEVQRKFYEREVSKLRRIQRMMGSINCYCEESLPELNLLLESMKQQRKKVEAALRKMEDMASLCVS
jgi:chromosome segregation ATPase